MASPQEASDFQYEIEEGNGRLVQFKELYKKKKHLCMNKAEEVTSGSIEYLTRYIITHSADLPGQAEAFVLTYRQFGEEPAKILEHTQALFDMCLKKKKSALPIAERRISIFLQLWVNVAYFADFKKTDLFEPLLQFLAKMDSHKPEIDNERKKAWTEAQKKREKKERKEKKEKEEKEEWNHFSISHASNVKLALLRAQKAYKASRQEVTEKDERNEKQLNFLEISATVLAEQLTLQESRMYKAVQPPELLNQNWSSPNKKQLAYNVSAMVARSNKVSYWVASEICMCRDPKKRVVALKRFINVAHKCYLMQNYNTTMEILGGLNNVAVGRLKRTWAELPERYEAMWDSLTDVMDNKNNFVTYREAIAQTKENRVPAVPFLGIFLRDLTFIEDGNPNMAEANHNHVNFEKIQLLGGVIRDVQAYQKYHYQFKVLPAITKYLRKALVLPDEPDETVYQLSLIVEPKATAATEDSAN